MNKHAIGYGYIQGGSGTTSGSRAAMTVEEFCEAYRIGRTTYYRLESEGKGPQSILIGRRRIITNEAAAKWCDALQAETAKAAA